jgi:hypothetical protein
VKSSSKPSKEVSSKSSPKISSRSSPQRSLNSWYAALRNLTSKNLKLPLSMSMDTIKTIIYANGYGKLFKRKWMSNRRGNSYSSLPDVIVHQLAASLLFRFMWDGRVQIQIDYRLRTPALTTFWYQSTHRRKSSEWSCWQQSWTLRDSASIEIIIV